MNGNNEENSGLYKAVNYERVGAGFKTQRSLSAAVGRQTTNFWDQMKKGSTKFNDVVKICNELGLEIVFRNKGNNVEHIINKPEKNESKTV